MIESAASNDWDQYVQGVLTGTSQGYIVRGFEILMANAIGNSASNLQLQVDPGSLMHILASQSGTVYMIPPGTPPQQLNSATNSNVTGSFSPNSINYISIDYIRFLDPSTDAQVYIWDPTSDTTTTENAPRGLILTYTLNISTVPPTGNLLPIAAVLTDGGNNVLSVSDERWLFLRLGTGGTNPNPFYTYPWPEGRDENPYTSTSNSTDPFSGGDKAFQDLKDWMNAVMSSIGEIKGGTYWYSATSADNLVYLREDAINTVITGAGNISHGILPNSIPVLITTGNIAASGGGTLGVAGGYAILAATSVTNSGSSILTGNLGISPGTSIAGFPPGTYTGTEDIDNAASAAAQAAALSAYNTLHALSSTPISAILDGQTLAPGVYTESSGTFNLAASGNGTLTLNGAGTYVFICSSTLTTGAGGIPTITLENGATAANVYWVVSSSATINSGHAGIFQGSILAQDSITDTIGGTVNGCLLALTGAVTLSAASNVNAVGSSGANQISSLASTIGIAVGQYVFGTGIPIGTTVLSIAGNTVFLSANVTATATGVNFSFFDPSVITQPGQINWDLPIYVDVIGSALSYEILANPSSDYITLANDQVAYITLVRGQTIIPNLIFTNGSAIVTSVGAISWTTSLVPGDFIRLSTDTDSGYYEIETVNSVSQVTLVNSFTEASTGASGAQALYAFGSYSAVATPSTSRNIYIADRADVPITANTFWLFLREDNGGSPKVYIRFLGAELDNGTDVEVGGTTPEQLLQYIGAPNFAATKPQYVDALSPGSVPQITSITVGAASTMASGEYFYIYSSASARTYAVWVNLDGGGVQPNAPDATNYIEWDIATGQTADQTAASLVAALNSTLNGDFAATASGDVVTVTNNSAGISSAAYNFSVGLGSSVLGTAATYAILGASAVTSTGFTILTGNLGLSPGTSITGFPPGVYSGVENIANGPAVLAQSAALSAYNTLEAMTPTPISAILDGQTLTPGVYSAGAPHLASSSAGTLTFNGAGTYVIQCGTTLTTGAGGVPTMILTGGATAGNIFWVVGSSATINSGFAGTFEGNIIASASITDTLGGTVNGSLIALNGAVTLSAAADVNAVTGSGSSFAISITQLGTGVGNYFIQDGENLTLAIKILDESLGEIEAVLEGPNYEETVTIVASGAAPPVTLNGPISPGTDITLPNNTRTGNVFQYFEVNSAKLEVFLNGQELLVGEDYTEVGVPGALSNQIQIQIELVVGDILEFRINSGGGSGLSGVEGPAGPSGPAGPPGANAVGGPVNISTKTSNYSVLLTDNVLNANCTSGAITFSLPAASASTGRVFFFKKIDSSLNAMIIQAAGFDLIDGASSETTIIQYQSYMLISDGSSWWNY
jgi:hypothetical protein